MYRCIILSHSYAPLDVRANVEGPELQPRPRIRPSLPSHAALAEKGFAHALPRVRVTGGRVFDEAALVAVYTAFERILE